MAGMQHPKVIAQLPPGSHWVVVQQLFDSPDNGLLHIAQAIQNGMAVALSDNSFKDGLGTSAIDIKAFDFH